MQRENFSTSGAGRKLHASGKGILEREKHGHFPLKFTYGKRERLFQCNQ